MSDSRAQFFATAALLLVAPPDPAAAQPQPGDLKGPAPTWVENLPLDLDRDFDQSTSTDGTHYHLVEVQSNQAEEARYRRVAYQLLNTEGVKNNSSLSFDFNPEYSAFTLNLLVVHREGEKLDRLGSQEIRLLQRESDLERNIYDGSYSAHLLLEDIRVGDTVDYAYTVTGTPPELNKHFFRSLSLQYSVPVGRYLVRHLAGPNRPFHHRVLWGDLAPEIVPGEGRTEYRWYQEDMPGYRYEHDTAFVLDMNATAPTTDPSGDHYHPLWPVAITVEYSLIALSFPLVAVSLYLFFAKRWTFPWVWMLILIVTVVNHASTAACALIIQNELLSQAVSTGALVGALIGACIWIPYFLVSRRVRHTFVRYPGAHSLDPAPHHDDAPQLPTSRA